MARDDCGLFFGRGTLPCSICGGLGYRAEGDEHVTCNSCSAGRCDCPACEGTGRRRVTVVKSGSLEENRRKAGDNASSSGPLSVAERQIRYNEALRQARKQQKDLLSLIERNQLDKRTKLDRDSYQKIRQWVRNLDLEAPGISGELNKVAAELKKLGGDDLVSEIEMLGYVCFRIDVYRPG